MVRRNIRKTFAFARKRKRRRRRRSRSDLDKSSRKKCIADDFDPDQDSDIEKDDKQHLQSAVNALDDYLPGHSSRMCR
jgi:hypothetical protein